MSLPYGRQSIFFNDTATAEIYTRALHVALPIFVDSFETMQNSQITVAGPHFPRLAQHSSRVCDTLMLHCCVRAWL